MNRMWKPRYALLLLAAVAVSIPASAGSPADVASSSWGIEGSFKMKMALGPMGETMRSESSVQALFGPMPLPEGSPVPFLAAGQFLLLFETSMVTIPVLGTYELDEKGYPVLSFPEQDLARLATEFEDVILALLAQAGLSDPTASLSAEDAAMSLKAKPKAKSSGDKMKLKMKCRIDMILTSQLGSTPVTLKLKFKGKGLRAVQS
jgi:hypothetical protein